MIFEHWKQAAFGIENATIDPYFELTPMTPACDDPTKGIASYYRCYRLMATRLEAALRRRILALGPLPEGFERYACTNDLIGLTATLKRYGKGVSQGLLKEAGIDKSSIYYFRVRYNAAHRFAGDSHIKRSLFCGDKVNSARLFWKRSLAHTAALYCFEYTRYIKNDNPPVVGVKPAWLIQRTRKMRTALIYAELTATFPDLVAAKVDPRWIVDTLLKAAPGHWHSRAHKSIYLRDTFDDRALVDLLFAFNASIMTRHDPNSSDPRVFEWSGTVYPYPKHLLYHRKRKLVVPSAYTPLTDMHLEQVTRIEATARAKQRYDAAMSDLYSPPDVLTPEEKAFLGEA